MGGELLTQYRSNKAGATTDISNDFVDLASTDEVEVPLVSWLPSATASMLFAAFLRLGMARVQRNER